MSKSAFVLLEKLKFVTAKLQEQTERVFSLEFDKKTLYDANQLAHQGWGEMEKKLDHLEAENARLREALEDIEAGKGDAIGGGTRSDTYASLMRRAERALSRQVSAPAETGGEGERGITPSLNNRTGSGASLTHPESESSWIPYGADSPCEPCPQLDWCGAKGPAHCKHLHFARKSPCLTRPEPQCPVCGAVGHADNCPDNPIHSEKENVR